MSNPANNPVDPNQSGASVEGASDGFEQRASGSRSIAKIIEPHALAPRALKQRKLIHLDPAVRKQADAFREIRTRLLAVGGGENFVTMVTAVNHKSGGSFVARNLAASFAFDESKTALLIDCDTRHPAQHGALGVDPVNGGLVDYLEHPAMGIGKILYHTGVPRLRLIPAGRQRELSGEYFSSFRMRAVLDSLRCRYADRYLVLDGPAVRDSPDARILADLADFIVVVVGYGRDTAGSITKALGNFDPDKVAGVVFNYSP